MNTNKRQKGKPARKVVRKVEGCPSCGLPWVQHNGIILTCAEVMRLRGVIASARRIFSEHGPSVIASVKMETTLNA